MEPGKALGDDHFLGIGPDPVFLEESAFQKVHPQGWEVGRSHLLLFHPDLLPRSPDMAFDLNVAPVEIPTGREIDGHANLPNSRESFQPLMEFLVERTPGAGLSVLVFGQGGLEGQDRLGIEPPLLTQ